VNIYKSHYANRGLLYSDKIGVFTYFFVSGDVVKIGHSGNPLRRIRTLNERYFEVFAVDQSRLIPWETQADARAYEKKLHLFARAIGMRAECPKIMDPCGHTEWYDARILCQIEAYSVALPLLDQIVQQLRERSENAAWSAEWLRADVDERERARGRYCATKAESDCINIVDEYGTFGVSLGAEVESRLVPWCEAQKRKYAATYPDR